jgi:hypothetical protein
MTKKKIEFRDIWRTIFELLQFHDISRRFSAFEGKFPSQNLKLKFSKYFPDGGRKYFFSGSEIIKNPTD